MGRRAARETLVPAGEVASGLPRAAGRQGAGTAAGAGLRRPRFLIRAAERARALGFDAVGIASPDAVADAGLRLRRFVGEGRHGTMAWMEETLDRRADPRVLWPDVRSAIVLGMNYGPDRDPLETLSQPGSGTLSVYARNRDYHEVIKGRLKEIAALVASGGAAVKVFVDTAPLMEKPLAAAAGIGWQGKHTNLVSRDFGSWLFLGVILTDAEIEPDEPEPDRCGSCRACLDACPTAAFPAPYQLDARRCISYLTIELAGPIPPEFREAMGNRIYGCDDCLAVCPWNKFASAAREAKLAARDDLVAPKLASLLALDDAAFRTLFAGSPVKRIGRDRFLRNVLVAAGNSADPGLAGPAEACLDDPAPVVRGGAVWALSRLDPPRLAAQAHRAPGEPDETVRDEWRMAGVCIPPPS